MSDLYFSPVRDLSVAVWLPCKHNDAAQTQYCFSPEWSEVFVRHTVMRQAGDEQVQELSRFCDLGTRQKLGVFLHHHHVGIPKVPSARSGHDVVHLAAVGQPAQWQSGLHCGRGLAE